MYLWNLHSNPKIAYTRLIGYYITETLMLHFPAWELTQIGKYTRNMPWITTTDPVLSTKSPMP